MSNLIPYQSGHWKGLADPSFASDFKDLDAWLENHPPTPDCDRGGRCIWRVATERMAVYVKHIWTLADGRHLVKDLLKRTRWYIRPSRYVHVARLHAAMLARGIVCPRPLVACRRRSVLGAPEDIFISEELAWSSVQTLLETVPKDAFFQELPRIVTALCEAHNKGLLHGDCIPGNLMWHDGALGFIDNDRTCLKRSSLPLRLRIKNLIQFCQILWWDKDRSYAECAIQAYARAVAPMQTLDTTALLDRIEKLLAAKYARRKKRGDMDEDTAQ